jgi:hypothetical protein
MDIERGAATPAEASSTAQPATAVQDGSWPVVTVLGRRVFDAAPEAVGEARRWLRSIVTGCEEARECLSEVFTNSIRHSRSGARRGPVAVVVLGVGSTVRVEVTDAGGCTRPRLLPLDEDATSGRGLYLVNELTGGRWGWHEDHGKRTVWFELSRTDA